MLPDNIFDSSLPDVWAICSALNHSGIIITNQRLTSSSVRQMSLNSLLPYAKIIPSLRCTVQKYRNGFFRTLFIFSKELSEYQILNLEHRRIQVHHIYRSRSWQDDVVSNKERHEQEHGWVPTTGHLCYMHWKIWIAKGPLQRRSFRNC